MLSYRLLKRLRYWLEYWLGTLMVIMYIERFIVNLLKLILFAHFNYRLFHLKDFLILRPSRY